MVNARLAQRGLPGRAVQGSMLDCPFPDEAFDCVVSIGCFHHTGDAQRCIDETWRVLRPGGRAYLMLYNRFSLRQWKTYPRQTLAAAWREATGRLDSVAASAAQRAAYDVDTQGRAAPETQFFSVGQVRAMTRRFARVECAKENCDDLLFKRQALLPSLGRALGLDIYIHAVKASRIVRSVTERTPSEAPLAG
jgi:SAM-dependent methyltransferase